MKRFTRSAHVLAAGGGGTPLRGLDAACIATIAASFALLVGCGRPPETEPEPTEPPPPATEACALFTDAATAAGEVEIALFDPVSPADAPRPGNDAERLLFRQAYETLIRLDCHGAIRPGLAESWRAEAGGRRWRFVLRRDATFWDGGAVTADRVIEGWSRGAESSGFDSLASDGQRALVVYMDSAYERVPTLFADPEHAVAGVARGSTWPPGTGPYRIEAPTPALDLSHLVVNALPTGAGSRPRLAFRLATPTDARDLVDGGIEVMVSRDPDILDYVSRRPDVRVLPLPWSRTYVLLSPTRVRRLRRAGADDEAPEWLPRLPAELRSALARDAVRGDARGHEGSAWWEVGARCRRERDRLRDLPPAIASAAYRLEGPWRVVYREGDEAARGLAERIVGLTAADRSGPLARAVPRLEGLDSPPVVAELASERFDQALRAGSEFLFVVDLPARVLDPCRHLSLLAERAPWLAVGRLAPGQTIVPLVDTRSHLIVQRGAVPLIVDWDGVVRVAGGIAGKLP